MNINPGQFYTYKSLFPVRTVQTTSVHMSFKHMLFLFLIVFSGCANNSGAYLIGDNQYQVATRATWEFGGRAGAKRMALETATDKCNSIGKTVKVINSVENYGHFEGGTVELTFSCENAEKH